MRQLLEAYKNESIKEDEKQELFNAIRACLQINLSPQEKRYFEVIVNRYLLREPLMLSDLAEIYNVNPESISTWEVKKGFELLASADTRMKCELGLRKWMKTAGKQWTERERAKKMWLLSDRTLTSVEIGKALGVSDKLVRKWKAKDRWEDEYKKCST